MLVLIIIIGVFGIVVSIHKNTITQTKKSIEHEAGEELVLEAKDFFDAEEDILAEMKIETSEVSANKVGEYEATATYKSQEYSIDVKVVDTTAPKVNLEVADEHGNAAYEEIVLILDKTGAKIEDVADKTITVSADKLSAEPTVDKSEYIINDNVDGKIKADDITCQLELRDEAKHEWLNHVSYVDRAGNESKETFLIIVKEGSATQTGNGGTTTENGSSSNQGGNTNSDTNKKPSNNQDVSTWVPTDDEKDPMEDYWEDGEIEWID